MGMRKPRKSRNNVFGVLPAVAASVTVFAGYTMLTVSGSRERDNDREPTVQSAGFLAIQPSQSFRRLEKRREGRGSQSELRIRLPHPSTIPAQNRTVEPLYSDQSMHAIDYVGTTGERKGTGWHYLNERIRKAIDAPQADARRWDGIVLHQSSTTGGNASMLSMYHRTVRGVEGGLAYHFLIGNGNYSPLGKIEIGERWGSQAPVGTPPGEAVDPRSISICLVGDFTNEPPQAAQLAALDELIHYLRAKVGDVELRSHSRSSDGMSSCPGRYFPRESMIERLNATSSLAASSMR